MREKSQGPIRDSFESGCCSFALQHRVSTLGQVAVIGAGPRKRRAAIQSATSFIERRLVLRRFADDGLDSGATLLGGQNPGQPGHEGGQAVA